eukprot:scaffold72391_cov20-Tisochrysis_lutea.AAC.1
MSLLIQWNGGVTMSNPARQINKNIRKIMQERKFDSAAELLKKSLGQLLNFYDNFADKTLTAPQAVRSRPSHNRQNLIHNLTNSALAPVKPEQFDWSILDSEEDEVNKTERTQTWRHKLPNLLWHARHISRHTLFCSYLTCSFALHPTPAPGSSNSALKQHLHRLNLKDDSDYCRTLGTCYKKIPFTHHLAHTHAPCPTLPRNLPIPPWSQLVPHQDRSVDERMHDHNLPYDAHLRYTGCSNLMMNSLLASSPRDANFDTPTHLSLMKWGSPPGLYFEQQGHTSYHCQVHAINNTFGACVVTPESLENFIYIQHRNDPTLGWLYAYEPGTGFSDDAP